MVSLERAIKVQVERKARPGLWVSGDYGCGNCAVVHRLDPAVRVPGETVHMRGKGVSRFDALGGQGWRLWTNVEGVVKEVLELSHKDRLKLGVLGGGLRVGH